MQIIDLSEFDYVRVSGPDTVSFLQGQLSCNMELLSPSKSLTGALCNLKGRVIADFRALQRGEDCLLQTSVGMAEIIVAALAKYAVFSKVELDVDNGPTQVLGVLDDAGGLADKFGELPARADDVVIRGDIQVVRLAGSGDRYQLWCWGAEAPASDPDFSVNAVAEDWSRADIEAGVIHVSKSMSEQYPPQLLNYDISGVIDFNKGCYTGQEVVARMFYRGKPKKRLYLVRAATDFEPAATIVQRYQDAEQSAEILSYSNPPDTGGATALALAVLNTDINEKQAGLSLSHKPQASLQILPLPYTE